MDGTSPIEEQSSPIAGREPLNWHLTAEEIGKMDEEQLRKAVIEMNEKTNRLYELCVTMGKMKLVGDSGQVLSEADVKGILNPELLAPHEDRSGL